MKTLGIGLLTLLFAGTAFGEIKVSHKTDMNLLWPLKLTLTPDSGETGAYRVSIWKGKKGETVDEKSYLKPGKWIQFDKPVTFTLAPDSERNYAVDYYSISAGGSHSATMQKTYHIYRFNSAFPAAQGETLKAAGIIPGKNIIHDQFDSAAMAPTPEEAAEFDPCTVGYNIYLPDDYYTNADQTKLYPVVYFLHGGRGNENALLPDLSYIHDAIKKKMIPPVVYVMAQGGSGGWFYHDHCKSAPRVMMETNITKELLAAVEAKYRVRRDQGGRAIQGFSMGGFGALKFGMSHPTLFSSIVVFSPGLDSQGNGLSEAQLDAGITTHNMELTDIVKRNAQAIPAMGLFITHGALGKDLVTIVKGTDALLAQLHELKIPFTFYQLDIGHGLTPNWKLKGDEALQFIAAHFHS